MDILQKKPTCNMNKSKLNEDATDMHSEEASEIYQILPLEDATYCQETSSDKNM